MENRRIIGRRIEHHSRVTSTNDLARARAEAEEPEGLVIVADEQTAGRGRLARTWLSPPGSSLQLSVLLRPPLGARDAFRLTRMVSLAVLATVEEMGLPGSLKWPNDVLLRGKKCAGILIETVLDANRVVFAVIGIGLNVNFRIADFPELAPYATTLADELEEPVDLTGLRHRLVEHLDNYYDRLLAGEGFVKEWTSRLVTLGQAVRISTPQGIVEGIAQDVEEGGALVVSTADGVVQLYAGDVTIIKQPSTD